MVNDTKAKQKRSTSEKLLFVLFILSVIMNMFMVVELSYERQDADFHLAVEEKLAETLTSCLEDNAKAIKLIEGYKSKAEACVNGN